MPAAHDTKNLNPDGVTVQVRHRYGADVENVFDAFLEPARASRFLFATHGGTMVRADIDARVGGQFNLTDSRNGQNFEHVGEYVEITRPKHLVFTFGVPAFSPLMTKVTIDIAPLPNRGCELTLTHEGVLEEYREKNVEGWNMILGNLDKVL